MSLDELVRSATSRAGVVRVSNALNPWLWCVAVASPLSWLAAYGFASDLILRDVLVGIGAFPIVAVVTAYFILLIRDPDRLQSEEFVLRQRELSIFERKAGPPITLNNTPIGDRPLAGRSDVQLSERDAK